MLKIISVLVVFLFCISFVSAGDSLEINLSKFNYGLDTNFLGNLYFSSDSLVAGDEEFSADISSCGSYSEKNIGLYELLVNSSLTNEPKYSYEKGSGSTSVSFDSSEYLIGLYMATSGMVSDFRFSVSGSGGPLKVDVGDDGIDWQYVGDFVGWSSPFYPNEECSSFDIEDGVSEFNPKNFAREFIEVEHSGLLGELDLRVNLIVKKMEPEGAGELVVRVGSQECIINDYIGSSWESVSCDVSVNALMNPMNLEVRVSADNDNFRLPRYPGTSGYDYYFISLQSARHSDELGALKVVNDSVLKSAVSSYRNSDCAGESWCLVPIRLYLESEGSVNLNSLNLAYGSTEDHYFYDVSETMNEFNLSGLAIPLDKFSSLVTPSRVDDDCRLLIEFSGEEAISRFNVSALPVAVIDSISYVPVNLAVEFSGQDSESSNLTIMDYSWDFGDDSSAKGAMVSHTYTSVGNYEVVLNVTDSAGQMGSVVKSISVVSAEDHLEIELPLAVSEIEYAISSLSGLSGDLNESYYLLDYPSVLEASNVSFNNLLSNFSSIRYSNLSAVLKAQRYGEMITDLHELKQGTPKSLVMGDMFNVDNLKLNSVSDIFDYGAVSVPSDEINYYFNDLYDFNQQNVEINMSSKILDIEFLEGSSNLAIITKSVSVRGGSNKVLVEDLRLYDASKIISLSHGFGGNGSILYGDMAGSTITISYAIEDVSVLSAINSVVFSQLDYYTPPVVWNESCNSSNCSFKWCGDNLCTRGYEDSVSCSEDCTSGAPVWIYVLLGLVFAGGLIYLNVERFRNIRIPNKKSGGDSVDILKLKNYVSMVRRQGYPDAEIRNALEKKGWVKEQLDSALAK
ncbi:PKD domain-containing protein [archaeon]|nr:PKD domain-containing protein [archaeon]MBT6824244.1 PKD domain-containing protein [archaeon]MBT7106782.1 PKD domain-containing protein [archaeon]MBT7297524.1 PKD domain-containing protein [archaeon]